MNSNVFLMKKNLLFILTLMTFTALKAQNYSEDIAPLIYKHCSNCHRPGEIGPFSLTNYNEVAAWGATIKYVTKIKYMPPWKPDPSYKQVQHENYLTDSEIKQIGDWVDKGMPQGDPAKEPPFPTFPTGSQVGTPDLVLSFSQSYLHKGDGKDEYRYFVLPSGLTEDKELVALEMRPGNKKVVHHTLFWADNTGAARAEDAKSAEYGFTGAGANVLRGDQLPGYVPGTKPAVFSNGMSQLIPKGSDLVLQMHYAPTSVDEYDSSTVNLFFSKTPAKRRVMSHILLPTDLVNGPFVISPNQVKQFEAVYKVPIKVSLIGIWPHCHMLGKNWTVYAKLPNGTQENLIKINDWDFNWQGGYSFNKPVVLPAGSEIHAFCTYDNTANNPSNPNSPPKFVTWGEGTADEMFYLPITYVLYQSGDENLSLNTANEKFEYEVDKIYPIYPNPVSEECNLGFVLNQNKEITVDILDEQGRLIKNILKSKRYLQGQHILPIETKDLISGQYIVRIMSPNTETMTAKMNILK